MKFFDYLNEEYATSIGKYPIFVDPTSKDLRELDLVKFIADASTKKFYVAEAIAMHIFLLGALENAKLVKRKAVLFGGDGEVVSGKIKFIGGSKELAPRNLDDFEWAQRYFTDESIKDIWKDK